MLVKAGQLAQRLENFVPESALDAHFVVSSVPEPVVTNVSWPAFIAV
jgi:hypothetical protein